jgi:hypothetical protein
MHMHACTPNAHKVAKPGCPTRGCACCTAVGLVCVGRVAPLFPQARNCFRCRDGWRATRSKYGCFPGEKTNKRCVGTELRACLRGHLLMLARAGADDNGCCCGGPPTGAQHCAARAPPLCPTPELPPVREAPLQGSLDAVLPPAALQGHFATSSTPPPSLATPLP